MANKLAKYRSKRDFEKTQEPSGATAVRKAEYPRFVIQKHDATRLHYDLRLEHDGVFKSWAVTKGPSLNPKDKRLAVEVEDHPLDYGDFEGTIPKGEYGGGTVMLWDRGFWLPEGTDDIDAALRKGELKFVLAGDKLQGGWVLVRLKNDRDGGGKRNNWLLIKHKDEWSTSDGEEAIRKDKSVASGRTMQQIAEGKGKAPTAVHAVGQARWHQTRCRVALQQEREDRNAPARQESGGQAQGAEQEARQEACRQARCRRAPRLAAGARGPTFLSNSSRCRHGASKRCRAGPFHCRETAVLMACMAVGSAQTRRADEGGLRALEGGELPTSTVALAKFLIGKVLVRDGGEGRVSGRIVETEAYPPGDDACHARSGRTRRNASLFLHTGHVYVYRAYGISMMLNISSEVEGVGAGVLIRAVEPIAGIDIMRRRRGIDDVYRLTRGPGCLAQALGVDLSLDGTAYAAGNALWLADDGAPCRRLAARYA